MKVVCVAECYSVIEGAAIYQDTYIKAFVYTLRARKIKQSLLSFAKIPSMQRGSKNTLYVIVLLALAICILLAVIYTFVYDYSFASLLAACIPNVISALATFVAIYFFFHLREIDTSFSGQNEVINSQDIVNNLSATLEPLLQKHSLSNEEIQGIAQALIQSFPMQKYISEQHARQIEDLRLQFANQLLHSYGMISNFRSELFAHFHNLIPQHTSFEIRNSEFELFRNICRFVTDSTRASLIEHFNSRNIDIGEDVAVTVKLIVPSDLLLELIQFSDEEQTKIKTRTEWVITVFRDSYTYTSYRHAREVGGTKLYDIRNNSAFQHIFDNGDDSFYSDDLRGLGRAYLNQNPNWSSYYNATIVVPISSKDRLSRNRFYGFLTADSKNIAHHPLYSTSECLHILQHAAELLTIYFLLMALYYNSNVQEAS